MSTFIELATRLRTECGVTGTNTTVIGAAGEWGRLCNWVAQAWIEIQEEQPDWEWMRASCTLNTVANDGEYSPSDFGLTDFASWRKNSFRLYLTSAGVGSQWLLPFKDYNSFRDYYLLSSRQTTYSRPSEMTIAPNQNILLGLAPDDIYTVTGEYYKTPMELTADSDTPEMPTRFHMMIVYKAMMSYGAFESAPEVYSRGEKQYRDMLAKLRMNQMPMLTRGGSLI